MPKRVALFVTTILATLVVAPSLAGAVTDAATPTPADIISVLNKQRRQNGIPAGIALNGTWSDRCRKHDRYMDKNRALTHYEDPDQPGYTEGGAWAGQNSVLSVGSTWKDGNVFNDAPIHLAQLLQPLLNKAGAFELHGNNGVWGCVTTWPGFNRPYAKTDRIYTYPGGGVTGVATEMDASTEGPCSTNDIVGISDKAGQQIFLFANGPAVAENPWEPWDVTKARLNPVGKAAVTLKIADGAKDMSRKCGSGKLGNYLGPGGSILIPVKPLKANTTYKVFVAMRANGHTLEKSWQFTTGNA